MSRKKIAYLRVTEEEKNEMKKNAAERGHQNVSAYLLYLWRADKKINKNNT